MISSTVWKRKLLWDICNAVLVFLLPFAIYLHLFFDNENTDIKIIGYYYEHGYSGTRTFVWMILLKLIPLLLLIIWFINTHKWWRYFLFLLMILWIDSLLRNTFFYPQIIENNEVILSIAINCLILTFVFLGDKILFRDIRQIKISLPLRKILLNHDKKLLRTIEKRGSSKNPSGQIRHYLHVQNMVLTKSILTKQIDRFFLITTDQFKVKKFEILIVIILVLTPLFFYSYKIIPHGLKIYNTNGLIIYDHGWPDVRTFVWYFNSKLITIIPLTIWFIVSRQWWRYAVLSPIILGIYQFIEGSRSTSHLADEIELLQSLPIILGVLTVLFLLSDIVNHRSKIILAYERISKEIELLFDKVKNEDKLYYKRKRFNLLKEKGFDQKSAKQNLNFLLNLRKELLDHLEVKN